MKKPASRKQNKFPSQRIPNTSYSVSGPPECPHFPFYLPDSAIPPSNLSVPSARRGSILVFVLVIITFLSAILLLYTEEALAKIKYWGLFYNRDDLRTQAYSMLEMTLAVLSEIREIDSTLSSPVQGWRQPLNYSGLTAPDGIQVSIEIQDESGKIPLVPHLDRALIIAFFDQMEGFDFILAGELYDCLIDWMDEDNDKLLNGYDGDDYRRDSPAIFPANRRIASWEEFRLIHKWKEVFYDEQGFPTNAFTRFREAFSLINEGKVNLNMINSEAMRVIALAYGLDVDWIRIYLAGPDGEPDTADDRILNGNDPELLRQLHLQNNQLLGFQIDVMKISIQVSRGDANFFISALVKYTGADPEAQNSRSSRTERQEEADASTPQDQGRITARNEDAGQALGYPFRFLQLVENVKL